MQVDDTIRRLQAYEKAGADVLFAIGLPDLESVRAVCAAVGKPVNFMAGMPGKSFSVAELESAMAAMVDAAHGVSAAGGFDWLADTLPGTRLVELLRAGSTAAGV